MFMPSSYSGYEVVAVKKEDGSVQVVKSNVVGPIYVNQMYLSESVLKDEVRRADSFAKVLILEAING